MKNPGAKAQLDEILKALEGMDYADWVKLRYAVDRCFSTKEEELKRQLQLPSTKEMKHFIP